MIGGSSLGLQFSFQLFQSLKLGYGNPKSQEPIETRVNIVEKNGISLGLKLCLYLYLHTYYIYFTYIPNICLTHYKNDQVHEKTRQHEQKLTERKEVMEINTQGFQIWDLPGIDFKITVHSI